MLGAAPSGQPNGRPGARPAEGVAVSATDKAKDKAEAAKGRVKKESGKALDDPVLEGKGKTGQMKGDLKQAAEKAKDAGRK